MHYFAPHLHPHQHSTVSLRASQYRKKPKLHHHQDHHDHHDHRHSTSPSPDQDDRLPPSPFPHAPATLSRPYLSTAKIQRELALPPSRLHTEPTNLRRPSQPRSASRQTDNLRRTHLDILSTLMHRCLQDHDYHRAGRAWGMILRTQATHGNTVHLRNHGRWGIGADILLHRNPRPTPTHPHPSPFSEQGFELAREYYDRLIVQHPARKQAPHAVDQRSFYPAMFSLWIQQVHETSSHSTHPSNDAPSQERSDDDPSQERSDDAPSQERSDDAPSQERSPQERRHDAQVEELAGAMEIAQRLDDLVSSPPFDKQASLLQLRGNIALWISDLIMANTLAAPTHDGDPYPSSDPLPPTEHIAKLRRCQRELSTAEAYLSRVEENGGPRQHRQMHKMETRSKELRNQIAKLETAQEDDSKVSIEDSW